MLRGWLLSVDSFTCLWAAWGFPEFVPVQFLLWMNHVSNAKTHRQCHSQLPATSTTQCTTQTFLTCCVKTILAASFSSGLYNNLAVCSELLAPSSWGMRLLHAVSGAGKAPAQPPDCCWSPHRQNCSRQMEEPMLEQQMAAGAKTPLRWKDQEANDEINPIKMWRAPPLMAQREICHANRNQLISGRIRVKTKGLFDFYHHLWKGLILFPTGKRAIARKFPLSDSTLETVMAPVWFSALGNTNNIPPSFPTELWPTFCLMTEGLNNHESPQQWDLRYKLLART